MVPYIEVKGIPFRQSAIHPFLSQVRLLSGVEKSAAGPASFVIFPEPFLRNFGLLGRSLYEISFRVFVSRIASSLELVFR